MKLQVLPDFEALSRGAAEMFLKLSEQYIALTGRFAVAVSGGRTPIRLYELLSSELYNQKIKWDKVHFFWADERFVPHDHAESNYRILQENLLSKISLPAENIHPVRTDVSSISTSAKIYEKEIRQFFGPAESKMAVFDLILLGIGEDGHTASLFPESPVLKEKNRLAAPVSDQKHEYPRVTLTLAAINNARNIVFLISGRQKAAAVKKIICDKDVTLPASLVKPAKGNLLFFLDEAAALLLEKKQREEQSLPVRDHFTSDI